MSFSTITLTGSTPEQYAQLLEQARALLHGESDRIAVMHEGTITGFLTREEASEEAIMQLAVNSQQLSAKAE